MDIEQAENVGIFGYVTDTVSFVGLNLENITVKGKNNVGGLIGYTKGDTTKVNEVVGKNLNISVTYPNIPTLSLPVLSIVKFFIYFIFPSIFPLNGLL